MFTGVFEEQGRFLGTRQVQYDFGAAYIDRGGASSAPIESGYVASRAYEFKVAPL